MRSPGKILLSGYLRRAGDAFVAIIHRGLDLGGRGGHRPLARGLLTALTFRGLGRRSAQRALDPRAPREVSPELSTLWLFGLLGRFAAVLVRQPRPTRTVPAHPEERQRDDRPRPREPLIRVHASAPPPFRVRHRPEPDGVAEPGPVAPVAAKLAAADETKVTRRAPDATKGHLDDGGYVRDQRRGRHPPAHGTHAAHLVNKLRNPSIRGVRSKVRHLYKS